MNTLTSRNFILWVLDGPWKVVWAELQVAAVGNSEGGISSNDLGVRKASRTWGSNKRTVGSQEFQTYRVGKGVQRQVVVAQGLGH